MKFGVSYGDSNKYKVEEIRDSVIYTEESKSDHLPGFYNLVLWKRYLKKKNTWKPVSGFQHLRKLISSFYKNYLNKLTAIFPAIDTALPMAKPIIKSNELPKQKQG